MRFDHFCYFSLNLKPFASGFLWFYFFYHFDPKINQLIFLKLNPDFFVLFLRGKMIIMSFIIINY
ncbi:hypothetical protein Hanom_Chr12g01146701 [Helianthus anomalus]